jgi:hypothetical protein
MNIDFKGYKHALVSKLCSKVDVIRQPFFDYPQFYEAGDYQYLKSNWTLHTNPDYKESEMNSNKLADEIMAKGKESVYTQEMKDRANLPELGMRFIVAEGEGDSRIVDFHGLEVLTIGISEFENNRVVTFQHPTQGIGCGVFYRGGFVRPIDQRTDIQKAIDDLYNNEYFDKEQGPRFLEDVKAGKFHGISFTGDKK